jgi:hypothetical protein
VVCSRIHEPQEALSAGTIALEIGGHNSRVAALPKRWDPLCTGLDLVLDERGADIRDLPGGASGSLVRGYKGKEADRLVNRAYRVNSSRSRPSRSEVALISAPARDPAEHRERTRVTQPM